MKLPASLSFLRGPLHKLRSLFLAFLGLRQYHLSSGSDKHDSLYLNMIQMLSDRVAILESLLNWRLYGMPSKIHNIKLEQMQFLSGSGDVETCLSQLKHVHSLRQPSSIFSQLASEKLNQKTCFFLDYNEVSQLPKDYFNLSKQKNTLIFDADNLFKYDEILIESLKKYNETFYVGMQSAMGRLGQPEFKSIWLSSFCERLTPIQFVILLTRARGALLPLLAHEETSQCLGIFAEYGKIDAGTYWLDPRRLKPMTKSYITTMASAAGFENVDFKDLADGQTLFILSK